MEKETKQEKIVLPEEIQKSIMKFFLRTSIPRKIRQDKLKEEETLPETKEQDNE